MKRIFRLPFFALMVLLPGCFAANQMELEGLKPAEVIIPASVQKITVVARCDLDSAYKEALISSGRRKDFNRDSIIAKQAVLGCSDAFLESPRFDINNPVVRRSLAPELTDPAEKLPWDLIRTVAGDPPVDAVLVLEDGAVNDTIASKVIEGWLTYHYVVYVKTAWRLYRLSDFQSKFYGFTDTINFEIESPQGFLSSPDQKIECIRDAMYESGVSSARRLAPWWTNFQRFYFAMGPLDFLDGAVLLKEGKWKEAAETWRPFTESSRKKLAAKACFNMSLTCEMANNIPAAFEWLRKSEKLGLPLYYIKDYQAKLAKRHIETDKLDQQMR